MSYESGDQSQADSNNDGSDEVVHVEHDLIFSSRGRMKVSEHEHPLIHRLQATKSDRSHISAMEGESCALARSSISPSLTSMHQCL